MEITKKKEEGSNRRHPDIDGEAAFNEALALQSELEAERQSGARISVNHFDRGRGKLERQGHP